MVLFGFNRDRLAGNGYRPVIVCRVERDQRTVHRAGTGVADDQIVSRPVGRRRLHEHVFRVAGRHPPLRGKGAGSEDRHGRVRLIDRAVLRPLPSRKLHFVRRREAAGGQSERIARIDLLCGHRPRAAVRVKGNADGRFCRKVDGDRDVRGHVGHAEGIAGARQKRRALGRNGRVRNVVSGVRNGVHGASRNGNAAPRGIVRDRADRVAHTAAGFAARR